MVGFKFLLWNSSLKFAFQRMGLNSKDRCGRKSYITKAQFCILVTINSLRWIRECLKVKLLVSQSSWSRDGTQISCTASRFLPARSHQKDSKERLGFSKDSNFGPLSRDTPLAPGDFKAKTVVSGFPKNWAPAWMIETDLPFWLYFFQLLLSSVLSF